MKFNLLEEPLIRVRGVDQSVVGLSLPEAYAALREDRVADFPALRPHQRHAWHAFLAQAATIAASKSGGALPVSAVGWTRLLRALTPGFVADEPWCLVVEDASRPAFMQVPAPDGLADYRGTAAAADDLDLLVTSRNHDVKRSMAFGGAAEDWLFALVDLQTMSGYLGGGNYGIARMNGGFSSRPCLGLAPATGGIGAHLFCDIDRMLEDRGALLERAAPRYLAEGGAELLWLDPWDGADSLDLGELDPYFVEVCRRVRLCFEGSRLVGRTATSRKPRVEAKAAKGVLGDFWTPAHVVDGGSVKALSISSAGFAYRRLWELLFDRAAYLPPPAMRAAGPKDKSAWRLVARGVARGQGKTEGYHERTDIRLSGPVAGGLFRKGTRDRLARLAREQVEEIAAVEAALRFAIAMVASGGKDADALAAAHRRRASPFARRLDREADAGFFEALERRFLASDEEAAKRERASFARHLIETARRLLGEAAEAVPCPTILRHRARAKGLSAFEGSLRGGVFEDQPEILAEAEGAATTASRGNGDDPPGIPADASEIAPRLAAKVAALDSGSAAALRRGPLAGAGAAAFRGLLEEHGIASRPRAWAAVVQAIAILTPAGGESGRGPHAHNPRQPMGAAMFRAGVSEPRLARLLASRGASRRDMLVRLCRGLAATRDRRSTGPDPRRFDMRTLGWFAIHESEEADRRIAAAYYRAERHPGFGMAGAPTTEED